MKGAWLALFPYAALAHMVSMSTGDVRVEGKRGVYELRMPSYEMAHVKDPERALFEHIRFSSAGAAGRPIEKSCRAQPGTYFCSATYEFANEVDRLDVECTFAAVTVPNHVHLLRASKKEGAGEKTDQAVFDISFTRAELRFRPPTRFELIFRQIAEGVMRALGGAAPILFLTSLILAARSRRELLALTGMFLTGELVSCLAAPQLSWQLSARFIEAAAALTIAYLAVEILLLPNAGQRWLVVAVLGLFHGYYFSLFLKDSGQGPGYFFAGVAVAEILFVAAAWLVVSRIKRMALSPKLVPVAASMLLTVGMIWFAVRLKG